MIVIILIICICCMKTNSLSGYLHAFLSLGSCLDSATMVTQYILLRRVKESVVIWIPRKTMHLKNFWFFFKRVPRFWRVFFPIFLYTVFFMQPSKLGHVREFKSLDTLLMQLRVCWMGRIWGTHVERIQKACIFVVRGFHDRKETCSNFSRRPLLSVLHDTFPSKSAVHGFLLLHKQVPILASNPHRPPIPNFGIQRISKEILAISL